MFDIEVWNGILKTVILAQAHPQVVFSVMLEPSTERDAFLCEPPFQIVCELQPISSITGLACSLLHLLRLSGLVVLVVLLRISRSTRNHDRVVWRGLASGRSQL